VSAASDGMGMGMGAGVGTARAGGVVGGSGPCVALIELASIAAGFETVDALRKEAAVELLLARTVSPGKFVILFTGSVEDTTSALRRGLETGADSLIDSLLIPNLEPTLLALVRGGAVSPEGAASGGAAAAMPATHGARAAGATRLPPTTLDAVGIIETLSVASTIRAADLAAKAASLRLLSLQLAVGIGGKSYVTFTGEVSDVEVAVAAGAADAQRAGMLVRRVVIARPHGDLAAVLGQ